MFVTRRHILAFAGDLFLSRLWASTLPTIASRFDVDRILATGDSPSGSVSRNYVCSAAVTLLSVRLFSKNSVGSGCTTIRENESGSRNTISIQFAAGSWPESAHGLNRLGFIQEAIVEERPGQPSECAYVAFMTTSQEKNIDQATQALQNSGDMIPYSAAQGCSSQGRIFSRVDRLEFAAGLTWRNIPALIARARAAMASNQTAPKEMPRTAGTTNAPATFLYAVRSAMLNPAARTSGQLFFNSTQFRLDTVKEKDLSIGAYFAEKHSVPSAESVVRLSAILTDHGSGDKTPFRIWYEKGAERMPPLRFEYQAKSFLRLTFEADPAVSVPFLDAHAIHKENA